MPIDDRSAWLELEVKRLSNMLESYQAWIKHMRQTQPDLVISNDGNVSVKGASKSTLTESNTFKSCPSIPDEVRDKLGLPLSQRLRRYTQSQIPVHQDMDSLIEEVQELERQADELDRILNIGADNLLDAANKYNAWYLEQKKKKNEVKRDSWADGKFIKKPKT